MKRAIALVVAVAYVMQLSGCGVSVGRLISPGSQLPSDILLGVNTEKGEKVRFDKEARNSPWYKAGDPIPDKWESAWIHANKCYGYIDGEVYEIDLNEVQVLWVLREDPLLSIGATILLIYGLIEAIRSAKTSGASGI